MHPKVVILTLYNKEAYILRKMQLLKKTPSSHYSNELIKIIKKKNFRSVLVGQFK